MSGGATKELAEMQSNWAFILEESGGVVEAFLRVMQKRRQERASSLCKHFWGSSEDPRSSQGTEFGRTPSPGSRRDLELPLAQGEGVRRIARARRAMGNHFPELQLSNRAALPKTFASRQGPQQQRRSPPKINKVNAPEMQRKTPRVAAAAALPLHLVRRRLSATQRWRGRRSFG
jgi:hypothetical protein